MSISEKEIKRKMFLLENWLSGSGLNGGKEILQQTVDKIKEYFDKKDVDKALCFLVDGVNRSIPYEKFDDDYKAVVFLSEYYGISLSDIYFLDELGHQMDQKYGEKMERKKAAKR